MEAKFANVPDALWTRIEPVLPVPPARPRGGRPRVPDRVVLAAIVYRLRTGCQWKALPAQFGSGSTCHLRFQQWVQAGVFEQMFAQLVRFYDVRRGIQWHWTSLDSATVKAPKGGTTQDRIRRTGGNAA